MFRKLMALLLALSVIFGFAGCVKNPEKNSTEIIPYLSGYKCDEENGYWTERLYGLMTADGKPFAEPIYNSYRSFKLGDKTYYCMQVMEGDWEPICHNSLLVSSDGTFKLELKDNIVCLSENRIICQQFEQPFTVYDYSGNKIFSGNEYQTVDTDGNGFYNGLLVVYDFLSEDNYMEIRDENGNIVFDRFDYCGPFITGKAVASYNRDEGYGIISADGEWLLDPVYDDIKTVDGKYFIAVDSGKEYIYDSDLKLLRERERGIYVNNQSYFFEANGKLLKYYANINAPDKFYRNAFTDEIISCDGTNATAHWEQLGLFYHFDEENRTAIVCDEKGKLLSRHENVDSITEYNGIYCIIDSKSEASYYYSSKTHKKLIALNYKENEWKPVSTVGDCGLLTIPDFKYFGENIYDGPYHLYDYKKGEYVFKNCEYCEINEYGGNAYVTVVYKDRIEIYDLNLDLIIKTENMCEK